MGFLGLLADHKLPHVPGTVILNEETAQSEAATGRLKHGEGNHQNLILVPQPSEDPNDPLNWPYREKLACVLIVAFGALMNCAVLAGLLSTGFTRIAVELKLPIRKIALLVGYQLLIGGVFGTCISAMARKWGKRPCFLFGGAVAIIGTIIDQCAKDYSTLLAGRMISGAGISCWESVGVAMIGDLFFVHERGRYIAIIHFTLATVTNLCNIITGPIVDYLGWKYLFHIFLPVCALQVILQFLFVPETTYIRDRRYELDEIADQNFEEVAMVEARRESRIDASEKTVGIESGDAEMMERVSTIQSRGAPPTRKTFWQRTAIFTGTYSDENFFVLLIAPIAVLSNLAAFWTSIVSGYVTVSYVALTFCMSQIFTAPPYLLTTTGVGLLFLGAFIGGTLGSLFMFTSFDPLIGWCTRKNKGIYEPEYRLLPTLFGLGGGAATIGFGYITQHGQSYYAAAVVHGILLFAVMTVLISTNSYILDAYREMSNETFVIAIIMKQFFFYGFSTFINGYLAEHGAFNTFTIIGVVTIALCATVPIMFLWGKRYRSFWHRYNVMDMLHINTHTAE